tara:strand:- start:69 stop:788 length:720 start_codon:yes stop_codon:yes gene_type:complete
MKIFYKILIISLFFFPQTKVNAGAATEYKISMTLLELCDSTSTLTACNNPVVIGSGDSGTIDIAGTEAGAAAASYGSLATVPMGTTFTYMQVTMKRAFTATGSATDGAGDVCYTKTNSNGADNSNASGHASTATSATLFLGFIGDVNGDATNSATAGDGTGTSRIATRVTSGDDFLEFRVALTTPLTLKPGTFPTVKVAFGTEAAIGAAGNMNTSAACDTGSASVGLYGAAPDVSVTFE